MYAALWVHPEPGEADDRIVVCRPLLSRQGTAVAVLSARKRKNARSLILSGEGSLLRKFLDSLDQVDDEWGQLNDDQLVWAITRKAETMGLSKVEFDEIHARVHAGREIAFRGSGPLGLKSMRPSSEGVYGPGIYFYDNPIDARIYASPGGGVIVAMVRGTRHGKRIIVAENASDVKVIGIVPTDLTIDRREYLAEITKISGRTYAHVVVAIRRIPKPGFYPQYITKEAKFIWDMVTNEHKDVLKQYSSDKEKMWAAAIMIFQRYAGDMGIVPFKQDPAADKVQKMAVNELNKRANNGNAKALRQAEKAFDQLRDAKMASRITNERFYEAAKHRSLYYITTRREIKLLRGVQPGAALRELLSSQGFQGQPARYAHRNIDAITDILVEPEDGNIVVYSTISLTKDQVILLFGLGEDVSDAAIIKRLGTAGRRWVKTGVLTEIR